ncbi:hypothetical protein [Enterovirga sp. CN4-39]|uniref:hypothetical protein n=1 Tax=Enterovirga sp. CN4-39 TaxID=3400910 RepID=UPI003BFAB180
MIWRTVTLGTVGLTAGILGLWVAQREPPVRILRATVLTPQVPPGGQLRIEYDVERVKSCGLRVDRLFYDKDRVRKPLEPLEWNVDPGRIGRDTLRVVVDVPRSFAEGRAIYRTIARYECNLVHRLWPIIPPSRDIEFEVKGAPV